MSPKEIGPEIPSPQDLVAFAKEYFKSYMESIEENKPQSLPRFAQDAPYSVKAYLLPNGCIAMIFQCAQEQKFEGGVKDFDEVQEIVVKGVEHFAGFFPFEGRSLGEWNRRGKRDALRDLRLMDKSELGRGGAELEGVMENITKMVKANPWLGKAGSEMMESLRSVEARVKGGFPTVDAIAALQSLKSYATGSEKVVIEFPDKNLLEEISEGLKNVASLEGKVDTVENRMFEIEKSSRTQEHQAKMADITERVDRVEKQLEKVSNILTMLNTKVENYFSKSAEKERQSDLEKVIEEHTTKAAANEAKIVSLEKEAEKLVAEIRKMTEKMDKDLQESRKRIARMERHFVDFAKMVQE